jgi:hypothetical protein
MSAGSSALSPQTTRSPPGGWARSCWWPATAWCCSPVAARTPGRHPRAGGHAVLPPGLPGRGGGCGDHPAGLAHRPGPLLIHSPEPWTVPEPAVLARGIGATRKQRRVSPHPPAALLGALAAGAPACGAFAAARRRPQAGLPVGLRSAPQAVRLRAATAAPLRSAHPSRQARRAPVTPRAKGRLRVTPLASLRLESCRGAQPPETPRPPAAGGPRAAAPARAMPATGTPAAPLALAQARQGSHRTRRTLRAHGLQHRPGALTPRHHERGVPPAWGAVVRPAAAPGLASRALLAPAAAGRRGPPEAAARPVRGPRLARRPSAARAGTPAWCPSCGPSRHRFWHPGPCLGPRAPGKRRPQPRSLRCAPPNGGRLRRGFDPATRQGQRLGVAAARCAPGACSTC